MPTKYKLELDVELEDGALELEVEGLIEDLAWRTRMHKARVVGGDYRLAKAKEVS